MLLQIILIDTVLDLVLNDRVYHFYNDIYVQLPAHRAIDHCCNYNKLCGVFPKLLFFYVYGGHLRF